MIFKSRILRPDPFIDPDLNALSPHARWLYLGLHTVADRAGRLEDDPRRIKALLLPFDDVDCNALLDELHPQFALRYFVGSRNYIEIQGFTKAQSIHKNEAKSTLPEIPGNSGELPEITATCTSTGTSTPTYTSTSTSTLTPTPTSTSTLTPLHQTIDEQMSEWEQTHQALFQADPEEYARQRHYARVRAAGVN